MFGFKKSFGNYGRPLSDYFTKWVEAIALPDATAITVAHRLVDTVITRYGAPTQIHSDQGPQFESKLFQHLCILLGIKKTRTTPYHPQSDGLVERFNRTLLSMLKVYCYDHQTDWDLFLQPVMMAYRTTVNETTRETPFFMLFGREAQLPVELQYQAPRALSQSVPQYIRCLADTFHDAYDRVRAVTSLAQRRQKKSHDHAASSNSFTVGDLVWRSTPKVKPGTSSKFHLPWSGPYRIIKKLSDVTFRIQNPALLRQRVVIHADNIKPYAGPPLFTGPLTPMVPQPSSSSTDDQPPQTLHLQDDDELLHLSDDDDDTTLQRRRPPQPQLTAQQQPPPQLQRNKRPPAWHRDYVLNLDDTDL